MFRRKEEAANASEGALFDTTQNYGSAPTTAQATVTIPQSTNNASHSNTSQQPQAAAQPAPRPAEVKAAAPAQSQQQPQHASVPVYRPANNDVARTSSRTSEPVKASVPTHNQGNKANRRILTVGQEILLKGEISACDRLLIEGRVDATVNDVHTVEIAESGSFKGSAEVEEAEISGLFEGTLSVRGRLVIYAAGKVRGKITYGEIEIERGGEISGEIKNSSAAVSAPSKKSQAA